MPGAVPAEDNTQLHIIGYQQQPSTEVAGRSLAVGRNNKQSKASAVGLVRVHSCLSPPNNLRRNSRGLPSATATYTALKKAALGGSLFPGSCQTVGAHSQQHVSQSIKQQEASMQSLRDTRPTVLCVPLVSYDPAQPAIYGFLNMCGGCIAYGRKPLLALCTCVLSPAVSTSNHCLC